MFNLIIGKLEENNYAINFKSELLRKGIHLSSSVIPFSYFFFSRNLFIVILSVITLIMILIDVLRYRNSSFRNLYMKFLGPILRKHEVGFKGNVFTGGTYLIAAYLLCVIIFPKPLAITSMFVIIFSDSFAAIFGKIYGKHFIGSKTIEGSAAFFLTGMIIIFISPKISNSIIEYYIGLISVLVTTVIELVPMKIDDNIFIPIFFGIIYLVLMKLFFV